MSSTTIQSVSPELKTISDNTDVQKHYQQTIQTHNAVSVAASAWATSIGIDCDGYDKISVTMKNDATASRTVNIQWSNDNSDFTIAETIITNASDTKGVGITDVKARYCKVNVYNADTVAHTMSAWAYLKA